MIKRILSIILILLILIAAIEKDYSYSFAVLKYSGGGDWYANPSSVPNLVEFCNKELNTNIDPNVATVDVGSPEIFNYPFIHMTGHGNVVFSNYDAENLKNYLLSGGFLHIDDNYGMDQFIRLELKKVFPDLELVQLPNNHEIYNQKFIFKNGLPKIHEHDGKNSQGLALIKDNRILVYYTYECDLGDGWEDQEVHNNSSATRQEALQMGANIVEFILGGQILNLPDQ